MPKLYIGVINDSWTKQKISKGNKKMRQIVNVSPNTSRTCHALWGYGHPYVVRALRRLLLADFFSLNTMVLMTKVLINLESVKWRYQPPTRLFYWDFDGFHCSLCLGLHGNLYAFIYISFRFSNNSFQINPSACDLVIVVDVECKTRIRLYCAEKLCWL